MYDGRGVLFVASLVLCVFAHGCQNDDRPSWPQTDPDGTAVSTPRIATTSDLVVYLDASMSIQGYVRADGGTVYGKTLRELRNLSSLMSRPLRVTVRRVDSTISNAAPDVELTRASMSRSFYSGLETNLAGAFAQFGPAVAATAPIPQRADVPILQIVVTDGVQSTDRPASKECAEGSDQICVRRQMLRWINSGWSAVLLGIRSEFEGTIYSEVNRRTPGRPYRIAYSSNPSNQETYRPFYIYAFSPEEGALAEFVAKLKRRLLAADGRIVIRELPVNMRYTEGTPTALVEYDRRASHLISVEVGVGKSPTDRLTVRVKARQSRPTAHPITLRVSIPWSPDARDMGTPEELARSLIWEVVPLDKKTRQRERRPTLAIGKVKVNKDGTVDVPIDPRWPAGTGDLAWTVVAVRAKLNFDEDSPRWIREWSTDLDTSAQYGNRTLFLESAVLGLWRNSRSQARSIGEIYVRIGP